MNNKTSLSTKKIVVAALMAALTVAGSAMRIKLPLDTGGSTAFHLGNIMCALSGILLGPWLGGLASGLGSAIYDILLDPMYISECWITFLTKGAYGLAAGLIAWSGKKPWGYTKATAATLAGAVTYAVLYLAKNYAEQLLIKGVPHAAAILTILGKLPATVFNAAVAIIFAPILAVSIRKALERNRLTLE